MVCELNCYTAIELFFFFFSFFRFGGKKIKVTDKIEQAFYCNESEYSALWSSVASSFSSHCQLNIGAQFWNH